MSCVIAHLDAPVVALQEIRDHRLARAKRSELLELLNQRTGGDWRLEIDHCPTVEETDSHLAFLFDARRVTADTFHTLGELNPQGGCRGEGHPGFGGYFRFAGGLDLQLVNVHMMWGTDERALAWRRQTRTSISHALGRVAEAVQDSDVVVLGDFNTNGCTGCVEPIDAVAEVEEARRVLGRGTPSLLLPRNDHSCTEYDGATPLPLDHIAVSAATREYPQDAQVSVAGVCAQLGCQPLANGPTRFHERLSDHCPIAVGLLDRDLD